MRRYVGFYWTLPVPFAGHTTLPEDIEAATAASRTLRYQRERVRRWVQEQGGTLVHERAAMEIAPDRGTAEGAAGVGPALKRAKAEGAELVLVDFAEAFGWRRHAPLWDRLEASGIPYTPLPPDPVPIDGVPFDPLEHFRTWDAAWRAFRATKPQRKATVQHVLGALPLAEMTHNQIAAHLNAEGLPTPTGKSWTKENLRKFLKEA